MAKNGVSGQDQNQSYQDVILVYRAVCEEDNIMYIACARVNFQLCQKNLKLCTFRVPELNTQYLWLLITNRYHVLSIKR